MLQAYQLKKKVQDGLAHILEHSSIVLCPDPALNVSVTAALWMTAEEDDIEQSCGGNSKVGKSTGAQLLLSIYKTFCLFSNAISRLTAEVSSSHISTPDYCDQGQIGTASAKPNLSVKLMGHFDIVTSYCTSKLTDMELDAIDHILNLPAWSNVGSQIPSNEQMSALGRCLKRHMAMAACMRQPSMTTAATSFLQQYFVVGSLD